MPRKKLPDDHANGHQARSFLRRDSASPKIASSTRSVKRSLFAIVSREIGSKPKAAHVMVGKPIADEDEAARVCMALNRREQNTIHWIETLAAEVA